KSRRQCLWRPQFDMHLPTYVRVCGSCGITFPPPYVCGVCYRFKIFPRVWAYKSTHVEKTLQDKTLI
ncbi:MAG: hypothetical protein P8I83_01405, partial [Paracoccaceae bacterium]|nr:hypothetical protein [Paracoccaceae bacterium]